MLHRKDRYVTEPRDFGGVPGPSTTALRDRQTPLNPRVCAASATTPNLRICTTSTHDVAGEDPIVSGMAGRYATALFELALENKCVDAVKADLERFDALVAQSPDLLRLVRSPVFGAEEQTKALAAVLDKA